jgi:hypothetical protein
VAGFVPATHVFEGGCVDGREGVDDRDKPGQGELELFSGCCKQPIFLNGSNGCAPTAPSCNVVSMLIEITAFKARRLASIDDIPRGNTSLLAGGLVPSSSVHLAGGRG